MAEEQKPVAVAEPVAPAVESTPAPAEAAPATTTETPAVAAEAKTEEPAKAAEEVKPIYDGTLTYNPTGNIFT